MTPAQDKAKHAEHRRPWRDNLEAVTMAIIMAVMLKYFAVEAYKIPTGSMQPTLLGNEDTGIFDRILVDKLSYHYRDPERFEVAVFKYPLDRSKNFIKRICGMPGEELMIRDGDLWTRADEKQEWKILRRPRPVQLEVWKRIDPEDSRYKAWKPLDSTRTWNVTGRSKVEARGSGGVRLPSDNGPVWDGYRDGYPSSMGTLLSRARSVSATNAVGDLRIEGYVSALPGCTKVTVEFHEGPRRYKLEMPGPAAPEGSKVRIGAELDHGSAPLEAFGSKPWKLPAKKSVSFAAQNMDDLLQIEVDGDIVATLEIPGTNDQAANYTLRVEGEGADFDDLELFRDIYYTGGTQGREFKIPPGCYVMLGDNTQDSSDSREWQFINYKWDGPGSLGKFVRGNYYKGQNPIPVTGDPEGTRIFFRDEWGELHNFVSKPDSLGPTEDAPFVPRNIIVGRAVTVFWPQTFLWWLWPPYWSERQHAPVIWRLKFVH